MFYADLSLPLHGPAAQGVTQAGAHCNIIQDTNGDACMVEVVNAVVGGGAAGREGEDGLVAGSGRRAPRVLRGWPAIDAALERRQRLLTWQLVQALLLRDAQLPQHERDADGAVAASLRLAAAAVAAAEAAVAAGSGTSSGLGSGEGMDMDTAAPSPPMPAPAAAEGAVWGGEWVLPSGMRSWTAQEIGSLLRLPSTQPEFEARALHLLAGLLGRRTCSRSCSCSGSPATLLPGLLHWLRNAALCHRVSASLRRQEAAAGGRAAVRQLAGGEGGEEVAVWEVARQGWEGAALVVVQGDCIQLEGAGACPASAGSSGGRGSNARMLSRVELDALLLVS